MKRFALAAAVLVGCWLSVSVAQDRSDGKLALPETDLILDPTNPPEEHPNIEKHETPPKPSHVNSLADVEEVAEEFMQLVAEGRYNEAVEFSTLYAPPGAVAEEDYGQWFEATMKPQVKGESSLRTVMVKDQTLADSIHRRSYLVKYPTFVVYYELHFYKPETTWQFQGFSFENRWEQVWAALFK